MMRGLAFAGLLLIAGANLAHAANCSQTVGASSEAVPFPTTGSGPSQPQQYLVICNAHASQSLGLNDVGGAAAIGSAGTLTLSPGGCKWYEGANQMPPLPHVIGSGAGTTTACFYR